MRVFHVDIEQIKVKLSVNFATAQQRLYDDDKFQDFTSTHTLPVENVSIAVYCNSTLPDVTPLILRLFRYNYHAHFVLLETRRFASNSNGYIYMLNNYAFK